MRTDRGRSRKQQLLDYGKKGTKALAPVANAFYDCSVMSLAAKDYSKKKFKDNTVAQLLFTLPVSLFAFGQSIGLNFSSTIEGIDETLDAMGKRKVPSSWVALSKRKEFLAIMIGLTVTLLVSMGDYCGGIFFVSTVPDDYDIEQDVNTNYWQMLCILTGIVAATTTAFTEGFDSYKETRNIIAGEFNAFATTVPGKLCYPLVIFAGIEAACETYSGMKNTIPGSTEFYLKYLLLLPALTKIISDFCFPGKLTLNAIDEFVISMNDVVEKTREEYVDMAQLRRLIWEARAEIAAFASTTGAAVWVEYSQCALTDDLLVDEGTKLPFDVPYVIRETLGWSATLRDGVLQMATLYPLFLYLAQKTLTNSHVSQTTANTQNSFMKSSLTFWRMAKEHKESGSRSEIQSLLEMAQPEYGTTPRSPKF